MPHNEMESKGSDAAEKGKTDAKTGKKKKPERNVRLPIFLHEGVGIQFWLPSVVLAVGAPGLGKTHFGRYMLYQMAQYVQCGLVICPNPASEDEWDCVPKKFISRKYTPELIRAFMADLERNNFPLSFLYVDDFIGNIDLDHPVWKELCTQFRKYKCFIWFGAQYLARAVPPVIRQCAQYVYMFRSNEMRSVEVMFRSFFSPFFLNPRMLEVALQRMPDKHHCLYLDIRDMKLNVVIAPSPDDLPDFFITWDILPEEVENERENMLEGQPHGKGELPKAFKRLEGAEAKRQTYEKEAIEEYSKHKQVGRPVEADEQTKAAAHGRALNQKADREKGTKRPALPGGINNVTVPQAPVVEVPNVGSKRTGQKRKAEFPAFDLGSKRARK